MSAPARLAAAVRRVGSPLCVGIDPWPERLPGRDDLGPHPSLAALATLAEDFGLCVVEAAAGRVAAVKPQFAFFEALGPAGMSALARVCTSAREAGLVVVGDAKRGDIGSTAAAYAAATLGPEAPFPCDWLTVSPFLGPESIEAFQVPDRGCFILLRTSNPGSARWQAPVREDLAGWIAAKNLECRDTSGYGPLGAVVGATTGAELAELRRALPHSWLLVPGFGAQGASAADARAALDAEGLGALIVSARGATFPARHDASFDSDPRSWISRRIDAVIAELAC